MEVVGGGREQLLLLPQRGLEIGQRVQGEGTAVSSWFPIPAQTSQSWKGKQTKEADNPPPLPSSSDRKPRPPRLKTKATGDAVPQHCAGHHVVHTALLIPTASFPQAPPCSPCIPELGPRVSPPSPERSSCGGHAHLQKPVLQTVPAGRSVIQDLGNCTFLSPTPPHLSPIWGPFP